MLFSIVVPAFNEAAHLPETLGSLSRAKASLRSETGTETEIIVVDNDSDDSTADVARALCATVAKESLHNVATVRNTGAKVSNGDVIVFVDADTIVPDRLLSRIADVMSDKICFGGALDTDYRPKKRTVRAYLQFWRIIGKLLGMAQGATQFFRKDVFFALTGYDETIYMGEDVDLFWRLKKYAKRHHGRVVFIDDIRVVPSTRRFDRWQFWRTLIWTNPLFILVFRRSPARWNDWYKSAPR